MNDLRDLKWQGETKSHSQGSTNSSAVNYNPIYQRQNNPFSQNHASNAVKPPAVTVVAQAATGDSFGDLVNFGTKKPEKLTMAQQAAAIQAQRAAQVSQVDMHFSNAAFFDQHLSRPSSTAPSTATSSFQQSSFIAPPHLKKTDTETSDDILAQINDHRSVDRSSYYPPPASPTRAPQTTNNDYTRSLVQNARQTANMDMFGIFDNEQSDKVPSQSALNLGFAESDAESILGDLAKPVQQKSSEPITTRQESSRPSTAQRFPSFSSSSSGDSSADEDLRRAKMESLSYHSESATEKPQARGGDPNAAYVSQIVEMGFSTRQAQVALAQTESGTDVAAAMELLLSLQGGNVSSKIEEPKSSSRETQVRTTDGRKPGQVQNERGDWVDSTYDLASKTLLSANNWFSNKSALARRKLAEFNASQASATHESRFDERPKWMRDAEKFERKDKGKAKAKAQQDEDDFTREEGLPMHPAERKLLELNGVLPAQTHSRRASVDSGKSGKSITGSLKSLPESIRSIGSNITGQQIKSAAVQANYSGDSRRFKSNDEDAASYVSSRRRRPAAATEQKPESNPYGPSGSRAQTATLAAKEELEEDLFGAPPPRRDKGKGKAVERSVGENFEQSIPAGRNGRSADSDENSVDLFSPPKHQPGASRTPGPKTIAEPRKVRPKRQVPYLDATNLATSTQHRTRGSEAFKRGDFAKALSYYDSSLHAIPSNHPIRILSLTNRAITQIQIGAPKPAIVDCDEALSIIGTENGVGEVIEDTGKQVEMTTLWSKAMTRKATALEMQERTQEALKVWQELVRSGLAGPQAMESRQRCEKLVAPKPKAVPARPSNKIQSRTSDASRVAVQKLRSENAKAAEDEAIKDSLYTVVETRINTWSAGKEQNLRALLSTLDQVLWPTSGWRKITLADLVINAKVKIMYMKALAKVHPDKISRDAGVEEKMIAAGVFSKLNSAWDAFKTTNNM